MICCMLLDYETNYVFVCVFLFDRVPYTISGKRQKMNCSIRFVVLGERHRFKT